MIKTDSKLLEICLVFMKLNWLFHGSLHVIMQQSYRMSKWEWLRAVFAIDVILQISHV